MSSTCKDDARAIPLTSSMDDWSIRSMVGAVRGVNEEEVMAEEGEAYVECKHEDDERVSASFNA